MSNSMQAIKRDRQSKRRNALRSSQRSHIRTVVKNARKGIINNAPNVIEVFKNATMMLDRMASKSVIHKNKAARLKSRLSRKLKTSIIKIIV